MIKVTVPVSISHSINQLFSFFLIIIWISSKFAVFFLAKPQQQHNDNKDSSFEKIRSTKTGATKEEGTNFLPDDLWAEVVCRLPQKHMVGCKLVSKSWNTLISQLCIPAFIVLKRPTKHLSYSWDFTHTINGSHWKIDSSLVNSFSSPALEPKCFLDSSNGFLLLRKGPFLCVFNPSTHQSLLLPQGPGGFMPRAAALIFDPPFSVVYILRNPIRIVVFSSATGKWVEHRNVHMDDKLGKAWKLRYVYLQGSIYILTSSSYLMKLDIKRPRITGIKLPEIVNKKDQCRPGSIGLSKNRLHYGWTNAKTNKLFVWMLDSSRWVLKHSIPLLDFAKDLLPGVLNDPIKLTTYEFHPTSDDLFVGNRVSIFRYHPHNKKLECIYKVPNGECIQAGEVRVRIFSRNLAILKYYNRISNNAPIGG